MLNRKSFLAALFAAPLAAYGCFYPKEIRPDFSSRDSFVDSQIRWKKANNKRSIREIYITKDDVPALKKFASENIFESSLFDDFSKTFPGLPVTGITWHLGAKQAKFA